MWLADMDCGRYGTDPLQSAGDCCTLNAPEDKAVNALLNTKNNKLF